MDERTRAYLYRIGAAGIALLVTLGWLTEDVASDVLLLAAALLGLGEVGMAAKHTSTKRHEP